MDSQDYLEVRISVADEDQSDIIVAMVSDLGFDAFTYADGELKCYIQSPLFDKAQLDACLGTDCPVCGGLSYSIQAMPKVNWNSEWEKNGFTPIECGSYVVMPEGAPYMGSREKILLRPQMAFGTGHHHTTYMMMEAMQDLSHEIKGATVMDLGCGTAVLAILAAKLGAAEVEAIDINEVAVRSSLENIALNGLDFPVICGDAHNLKKNAYDILLANIHRNIIIEDMPLYAAAVKKGGKLLLSGFLEEDVQDIMAAASANDFTSAEMMTPSIRTREGWYNIILSRI